MLMRYTAVTLLLAVLAASAVRAQSPRRESPSSSELQDQAREEEVVMPVKPQPGAPLRLSVKAYRVAGSGFFRFKASVKNVSDRDIGAYSIRRAAVGDERPGHESWGGKLPDFSWPGQALRPGQADEKQNPGQNPWTPPPSRLSPQDIFEVHSVVFIDGTIWCADVCPAAEFSAGRLAGGRAATERLLKVLSGGGLDAVVTALREKVAEDDPVPAVVVTTGPLVDIKPPPGHTPDWEKGFRDATKSVADSLWQEYVHQGTGGIEYRLRDGYRVEVAQEPRDPCADAKAQVTRLEGRLKDWPALARYHDANAKVAPSSKGEQRVVFMGDSITDSWDDPKYGGFFPGKPYLDRGISGQTTPQMLIRFRPDVLALKPRVVVILAGTNDLAGNTGPTTLEAIEDNLVSMAELAWANDIRVVFASLLPVSDYEKRDGKQIVQTVRRPPAQILALNEWMKSYAAAHGSTYLDYHTAMADEKGFLKDELSDDGLHPNAKGYEVMAPLAERAVAAALKKKR
jgi:lysophospholipase L1-like esterase